MSNEKPRTFKITNFKQPYYGKYHKLELFGDTVIGNGVPTELKGLMHGNDVPLMERIGRHWVLTGKAIYEREELDIASKEMRRLYLELKEAIEKERTAPESEYDEACVVVYNCRKAFNEAFEKHNGFAPDDLWKVI